MPGIQKFNLREWLVPPILLPILLGLVIAGAIVIQWQSAVDTLRGILSHGWSNQKNDDWRFHDSSIERGLPMIACQTLGSPEQLFLI